jgi:hypothetical protein
MEIVMKRSFPYLLCALAAGCNGLSSHPGMPGDAAPPIADAPGDAGPPPETQLLGLNDISIFGPPPFGSALLGNINGIDLPQDLVPRALFARLVTSHGDIQNDFEEFGIVAVRFDVCDRSAPGRCPDGADGSMRLVFQPLATIPIDTFADVGLHAFYVIPAAQLPAVVNELRAIARIARVPRTNQLAARSFTTETSRIRSLIAKYATPDRLIRLSVMGQDARSTDLKIVFRGLELHDGQMVDIQIPSVDVTQQTVTLADTDPSYVAAPVADSPAGLALVLSSGAFNAATPDAQRSALDALAATENPLLHTASTVQCVACHTSTYLGAHRGQVAGIDLRSLPSRYDTTQDVRTSFGMAATDSRSLHNFGWVGETRELSQRVANETAQALLEMEQRFPVPQ